MIFLSRTFNIGEILLKLSAPAAAKGPLFFLQESDGSEILAWSARAHGSLAWAKEQRGPVIGGLSFWREWSGEAGSGAREKKENFWKDFSPEFFFSPEFILRRKGSEVFLTLFPGGGKNEAALLKEWEALLSSPLPRIQSPSIAMKEGAQLKSDWEIACAKASKALQSGEIQKMVMARYKQGELSPGAAPFLLQQLLALPGSNVHKYVFREKEDFFIGASPEYLFQYSQNTLSIPAVAGTRPRGKTPEEDAAFEKELFQSPKEREEHDLVARFIQENFAAISMGTISYGAPEIRKLARLQHLYTPLAAKVSGEANPLGWLQTFHPTPAMGGMPREKALKQLKSLENWERGYFASPMGFFLPEENSAIFIVGIRGLLVCQKEVFSFAGAGYMPESQAGAEWQETEEKMQTILQLFGRGRL